MKKPYKYKQKRTKEKINIYHYLLSIIFILSVPFITMLFYGEYDIVDRTLIKVLFIISFIIGVLLTIFVFHFFKEKIERKKLIIAFIISLFLTSSVYQYSFYGSIFISEKITNYTNLFFNIDLIKCLISILALPSMTIFIYYAIKKLYQPVTKAIEETNSFEKKFILITTIIGFILTLLIYSKTNSFYLPYYCTDDNCEFAFYDVIFTTDSGVLNKYNTYMDLSYVENDVRQPLFGLLALPFSVTAKLISSFLEFIPNSYYIVFNTIQILLLSITIIMISRMINKKEKNIGFILMYLSSFGFILFSFVSEQYIISLFYLILAIYLWYFEKGETNYSYIGAVGSLLTSGIIFPMITSKKSIKEWIKSTTKVFFAFLAILLLTGRIIVFSKERIEFLLVFTGQKIGMLSKIKQFLYFVQTILIAPFNTIIKMENNFMCFRLNDINKISYIGIIILILCYISVLLNRKKLFALISWLWIVFSFIILCIVGWGTQENGLILYTLYFSWAYLVLIYLLIKKIKNNIIRNSLYTILITIMLSTSIKVFIDIMIFSLKYYNI